MRFLSMVIAFGLGDPSYSQGEIGFSLKSAVVGGFDAFTYFALIHSTALFLSTFFVLRSKPLESLWKSVVTASLGVLLVQYRDLLSLPTTVLRTIVGVFCVVVFYLCFRPAPRNLPFCLGVYIVSLVTVSLLASTAADEIYQRIYGFHPCFMLMP